MLITGQNFARVGSNPDSQPSNYGKKQRGCCSAMVICPCSDGLSCAMTTSTYFDRVQKHVWRKHQNIRVHGQVKSEKEPYFVLFPFFLNNGVISFFRIKITLAVCNRNLRDLGPEPHLEPRRLIAKKQSGRCPTVGIVQETAALYNNFGADNWYQDTSPLDPEISTRYHSKIMRTSCE